MRCEMLYNIYYILYKSDFCRVNVYNDDNISIHRCTVYARLYYDV